MPKLTQIKTESDDLAATLERLRRNSGAMIEYHMILADVRYKAFEGYVKAGFTEEQALELVKSL